MTRTSPAAEVVAQRTLAAGRAAAWFAVMLDATVVEICPAGVLAGPARCDVAAANERMAEHGSRGGADNRHFPLAVDSLMALGFVGIAARARANAERAGGEQASYLCAIAQCHEAAVGFVARHAEEASRLAEKAEGGERVRLLCVADNCRVVAGGPPATFAQAVQLFWFAYVMRNGSASSAIGRLDQHLYPFYAADVAAGRLMRSDALELLRELWEAFNRVGSGDTLMNLMLGGVDADGNDATNEVSHLMLEADCLVHRTEPHVNVRIHAGTPESFRDQLVTLLLKGGGKGNVFNDDALVPALTAHGVPPEIARLYCNDGCDEVLFDSRSMIEFTLVEAVKSFELALFNGRENVQPVATPRANYHLASDNPPEVRTNLALGYRSGDVAAMASFEEILEAFCDQYLHQATVKLDKFCTGVCHRQRDDVTSPFLAGTFGPCLATGDDPLRGGVERRVYMIFSGSLPTVADGLAAIRKVVFEDGAATMAELLDALAADWVGHEALRRRCLAAPKFGNDDDYVDSIAAYVAERYCRFVLDYDGGLDFPIYPALFSHVFNQWSRVVAATPDGRRWSEPICAHWSPTPGRAKAGPTACIRSLAKAPFALATGTATTMFAVDRGCVPQDDAGRAVMRSLLDTALSLGISVVNASILDVEALQAAKRNPEQYAGLMVRVWGFSARFVTLDEYMQDHIIARAMAQRN